MRRLWGENKRWGRTGGKKEKREMEGDGKDGTRDGKETRGKEEEEKGREGARRRCDEPKRVPFPGRGAQRVRRG